MCSSYIGLRAARSNHHLGLGMILVRGARMLVQLYSTHLPSKITLELDIVELDYKAHTRLAVSMYPGSPTSIDYPMTSFGFSAMAV